MEMGKAAFVLLFAVALISAAMAHGGHRNAEAPASHSMPAPAPKSGGVALGPFLGASLLSFVAYYLQF
ncbi:hypothetical protein VNO78_13058 [Psophocarpus tetragonolobus]|uniref:Uncharacterized protein n=1 Tax=Psophocarpus tetragonolobus TaxID=3891 RepID=A0AAN9XPC4_PSOTE